MTNEHLKSAMQEPHSSQSASVDISSKGTLLVAKEEFSPTPNFLRKDSLEYMIYVACLLAAVVYLGPYDMIAYSRTHAKSIEEYLTPPKIPFCWLKSLGMDSSDLQWSNFSFALPVILPFFFVYVYFSHKVRRRVKPGNSLLFHLFHIVTGLIVAFGISGPGFIYALFLTLGNYYLILPLHRRLSYTFYMVIMWGTHIAFLFLNYYFDGYGFSWLGISFLSGGTSSVIRWNVVYNMTVLRMIAFNVDYYEAATSGGNKAEKVAYVHDMTCIECAQVRELNTVRTHIPFSGGTEQSDNSDFLRCYKYRTERPRPLLDYNIWAYLGYILYPPLYLTGPMSSFNAYASYAQIPTQAYSRAALIKYGLHALLSFFIMFTTLHYIYIAAILVDNNVFQTFAFSRRISILYLSLGFLWLKFNCIWKLFRFFTLLDGFDAPEDMRRCFSNMVNIQSFWRDWHASFNLWITRYMYIPMGGSQNKFFSIFPIFFFIAIWHDIELRLLHWAGIMCCCFILELLVTQVMMHPKGRLHIVLSKRPLLYRYLRVFGTVLSMLELGVGNLVGFRISFGGAVDILYSFWSELTIEIFILTSVLLYFGASLSIQDRDQKAYEEHLNRIKYGLTTKKSLSSHFPKNVFVVSSPTHMRQEKKDVSPPNTFTEIRSAYSE